MGYWKSSESNPVKILIVIVLLGIAGYFVYANSHQRSLENTAQVTPADRQKKKGGDTGTKYSCLDGAPTGTLVPALGPSFPVTTVYTGTQVGGRNQIRGAWTLKNPGDCPLKLTDVSFSLDTNLAGTWTPMQNVRFFVATTPFGTALPFPTPDTVVCAASNARCVMSFSDTTGYVINPGATVQLRLVSDTLNVPGGTWYNTKLNAFKATNPGTGGVFSWTGPSIPAAVINVHD